MTIRTRDGIEVQIVKVIQEYQNGTTKVGVKQVDQMHYDIVITSNLDADDGPTEIRAAIERLAEGEPNGGRRLLFGGRQPPSP